MVIEVQVLFASELLSASLALLIVYSMLRSFRVIRREYLLAFPIGFSFLAVSYVTLGVSYAFPLLHEAASWIHLLLQSYGYAFLAGSYFLKKRGAAWASVWLFSLLVIIGVAAALVVAFPPYLQLPPYHVADEIFRILNIGLLSYIVLSMNQALKAEPLQVSSMVLAGFTFLGISQYSLLLWALDNGFWSFALAHLMRIAGLVALLIVMAKGSRGA